MFLGLGEDVAAGDGEELPRWGQDGVWGLAVPCSDAQASLLNWLPSLVELTAPLSC